MQLISKLAVFCVVALTAAFAITLGAAVIEADDGALSSRRPTKRPAP